MSSQAWSDLAERRIHLNTYKRLQFVVSFARMCCGYILHFALELPGKKRIKSEPIIVDKYKCLTPDTKANWIWCKVWNAICSKRFISINPAIELTLNDRARTQEHIQNRCSHVNCIHVYILIYLRLLRLMCDLRWPQVWSILNLSLVFFDLALWNYCYNSPKIRWIDRWRSVFETMNFLTEQSQRSAQLFNIQE